MFGWLSGFWAQAGSVANWRYATFFRHLGEAAAPGGGECGPCPDFASYTLAFALQLRKITENLSQGNRKALGWSAPNAILLVDLANAGDDLDWPAGPCRPRLSRQATGSTVGQLKYLPSCRTRGFPTSANFESKLAVRALMWSANSRTPRSSCICLLLTCQGAPVARRRRWDLASVASKHGCGQQTSRRGTHNPSWGGWSACIAGLRSWRIDHSSSSGGDPAYLSFEMNRCINSTDDIYLHCIPCYSEF
jgi:hypothetical protein